MTSFICDNIDNTVLRDICLKVAQENPASTIFEMIKSQWDFDRMLKSSSHLIIEELYRNFQETAYTRLVRTVDWPVNLS